MADRQSFRVGFVRVRRLASGRWQIDFRDPQTRRRRRMAIRAVSEKQARERAMHLDREIAAGRGLPGTKRAFNPPVAKAMAEAIEGSHANGETRRDYARLANLFIAWLESSRAGVARWGDLTTKIVQDYLAHSQRRLGLSNDQVRKRLYVVRMTSRFMADTYEGQFHDMARKVRFVPSRVNPLEREKRETRKALSAADLLAFLAHIERRRPDIHAIACLQGLAGLRAREAAHLREQDVDFKAGTVTVTETPHHLPKNQASYRTIPVAPRVMRSLARALEGLKVRRPDGYLFATRRGKKPWSICGLNRAMKRELLACWREAGIEALREFQPHWLRSTFVSLVRAQNVDPRVVKRYIGHSLSDALGAHYEQIDVERMRAEILPAVGKIRHESGKARIARR